VKHSPRPGHHWNSSASSFHRQKIEAQRREGPTFWHLVNRAISCRASWLLSLEPIEPFIFLVSYKNGLLSLGRDIMICKAASHILISLDT
jgi:hypothetical protein